MIPKGKLFIIGGAEDKGGEETPDMEASNKQFEHFEILKTLLTKGKSSRIEIITTASQVPEEIKKMYTKAFHKIGCENIGFMHMTKKTDARNEKFEKRLQEANVVFFSGGDQLRISTIVGGTRLQEILLEKYEHEKDFVVAGTSAGAMALPATMMCSGGTQEALLNTDIKTTSGLCLLRKCIVDTHFIKRGRFGRLAHAVMINPGQLGIGLGEDTALVISKGSEAECFGSGMVVIIDGKAIGQTNILEAEPGCPVFVENLVVHLLVKGCRFSLEERKFHDPAMAPVKNKK